MKKPGLLLLLLSFLCALGAHPMPNTLIEVGVMPSQLVLSIKIPLNDLESVLTSIPESMPGEATPSPATTEALKAYLLKHLALKSPEGASWTIHITALDTLSITDPLLGNFSELQAQLTAVPPAGADKRRFSMYYDAVMHQIVTHQAIVSISQDWANGIHADTDSLTRMLSVIQVEPSTGEILPLSVNLQNGSHWKGFVAMLHLGMQHIAEGYDHLLFLLLLLVVGPLVAQHARWIGFGGWRYGLVRLLQIITAFTIGHSITLAVCSLGIVGFSSRWVEVAIAFSILVSAIHLLRPLFFNKEIGVAGGFGLIHGMAFSDTLRPLQLEKAQLLWSLLGFNLGIEAVQLLIVLVVMVPIFALSRTRYYPFFRWVVGLLAILAALYWAWERLFLT